MGGIPRFRWPYLLLFTWYFDRECTLRLERREQPYITREYEREQGRLQQASGVAERGRREFRDREHNRAASAPPSVSIDLCAICQVDPAVEGERLFQCEHSPFCAGGCRDTYLVGRTTEGRAYTVVCPLCRSGRRRETRPIAPPVVAPPRHPSVAAAPGPPAIALSPQEVQAWEGLHGGAEHASEGHITMRSCAVDAAGLFEIWVNGKWLGLVGIADRTPGVGGFWTLKP